MAENNIRINHLTRSIVGLEQKMQDTVDTMLDDIRAMKAALMELQKANTRTARDTLNQFTQRVQRPSDLATIEFCTRLDFDNLFTTESPLVQTALRELGTVKFPTLNDQFDTCEVGCWASNESDFDALLTTLNYGNTPGAATDVSRLYHIAVDTLTDILFDLASGTGESILRAYHFAKNVWEDKVHHKNPGATRTVRLAIHVLSQDPLFNLVNQDAGIKTAITCESIDSDEDTHNLLMQLYNDALRAKRG